MPKARVTQPDPSDDEVARRGQPRRVAHVEGGIGPDCPTCRSNPPGGTCPDCGYVAD